jgi:hypothetical protein
MTLTTTKKAAPLPTLSKDSGLENSQFAQAPYEGDTFSIEEVARHLCTTVVEVEAMHCGIGALLVNKQVAISQPFTFEQDEAKWHGSQHGSYQWLEDACEYLPAAVLHSNGWVLSAVGYQEGTRFPVLHRGDSLPVAPKA